MAAATLARTADAPAVGVTAADDHADGVPARRGRPRRADADEAILSATIELLGSTGAAALSMDVVAHRAGVGKATIYRRWSSKEALVLDALTMATSPVPTPDTGSLRGDLAAYTAALVERMGAHRGSDVLPHLIEASCFDEHLRASLDDYVRTRQQTVRAILGRGIERGELPATSDVDLLVDVLLGPFFYRRLLTSDPIDEAFAERLVDLVVSLP